MRRLPRGSRRLRRRSTRRPRTRWPVASLRASTSRSSLKVRRRAGRAGYEQRLVGVRADPGSLRRRRCCPAVLVTNSIQMPYRQRAQLPRTRPVPPRARRQACRAQSHVRSSPRRERALQLAPRVRCARPGRHPRRGRWRAGGRSRWLRRRGSRPVPARPHARRERRVRMRLAAAVTGVDDRRGGLQRSPPVADSSPCRSRVSVSTSDHAWFSRSARNCGRRGRRSGARSRRWRACATSSFSRPRAASTWRRSAISVLRAHGPRSRIARCRLRLGEDVEVAVGVLLDDVATACCSGPSHLRVDVVLGQPTGADSATPCSAACRAGWLASHEEARGRAARAAAAASAGVGPGPRRRCALRSSRCDLGQEQRRSSSKVSLSALGQGHALAMHAGAPGRAGSA